MYESQNLARGVPEGASCCIFAQAVVSFGLPMQAEEQTVLRRLWGVVAVAACVRLLSSLTEKGVLKLRGSVYTELEQGDFLLSRSVDGTGERLSSRSAGMELIVVHISGIRFLMSGVNQCLEIGFGACILGNPSEERFALGSPVWTKLGMSSRPQAEP